MSHFLNSVDRCMKAQKSEEHPVSKEDFMQRPQQIREEPAQVTKQKETPYAIMAECNIDQKIYS
jgi:hypothetical protein